MSAIEKPLASQGEASVPLLADQEPSPAPPANSALSALAPASPGGPKSVIYLCRPKYPASRTVKRQDVVSVLGRDRAETVELALEIFPDLSTVSPDRLLFSVASNPGARSEGDMQWARISDRAWAGLQAETVQVIRVEIADLPGDAKLRRNDTIQGVLLAAFVILSIWGSLTWLVMFLVR